jgi:hypothetical protein
LHSKSDNQMCVGVANEQLHTTWYSGWYNGLAKKHYIHVTRAKLFEHEVILYCKANPGVKIITAIDVLLKDEKLADAFK